MQFLSHYVYTAPNNKVNDWLVKQMRKKSQVPDLFTPDGFVAGQMIVQALKKGDYDVDKMISRARGLEVPRAEGLPGDPAAGSRDAAADVPASRSPDGSKVWTAKVLGTASSYKTAPPITTAFQS